MQSAAASSTVGCGLTKRLRLGRHGSTRTITRATSRRGGPLPYCLAHCPSRSVEHRGHLQGPRRRRFAEAGVDLVRCTSLLCALTPEDGGTADSSGQPQHSIPRWASLGDDRRRAGVRGHRSALEGHRSPVERGKGLDVRHHLATGTGDTRPSGAPGTPTRRTEPGTHPEEASEAKTMMERASCQPAMRRPGRARAGVRAGTSPTQHLDL